MKIAVDLRPLQNSYANRGIGRYTRELWSRLVKRTEMVALSFQNQPLPLAGIDKVIPIPLTKRPWLWDQSRLPLLLRQEKVELFHATVAMGPLDSISYPLAFARKTVATLHDWHMFHSEAPPIQRFYRSTTRIRLQRWSLPYLSGILVHSQVVAEETSARLGKRCPAIRVTPLAGEHLGQIALDPELSKLHPLGKPYVLTVGDSANKNLAFARQVIEALREHHPEIHWIACGMREAILEQTGFSENTVPNWLVIQSQLDDSQLALLYRNAEALLFPSTEEGYGLPVAEALACRCPVFASDIPSHREILAEYPSLVLDPIIWVKKLSDLLEKKDEKQKWIVAAEHRTQHLSWDHCAELTWEFFLSRLGS